MYIKKGDKEDVNNYRSIAKLSGFSKIFVRAMSHRINVYLENKIIPSPNNKTDSKNTNRPVW